MTRNRGKLYQKIRIISQILFTILFFYLLIRTGQALVESFTFSDSFFYFDPLIFLATLISTGKIVPLLLLSMIPVLLTLIIGRFFCGWACPLGAINQLFTWIFRKSGKKRIQVNRKHLGVKYIILIILLVSCLFGTQLAGWLDPFSLLTRSSSVSVLPAANFVITQSLHKGAEDTGLAAKVLKPFYNFARGHIIRNKARGFVQAVFIGLLFLMILLLNHNRRRFFCNYICPLGALYGFLSKYTLFNLKLNEKCIECRACANHCTYYGSPFENYLKSECMVCLNCIADCPTDAIDIKLAAPVKERRLGIDLGRRKAIGSLTSGIFLAVLPKVSFATKSKPHPFNRPVGSIVEKEFLKKCVRCGECMQVCPTNFIQPAIFQAGIEGFWTPVLNARLGYCEFECKKCTEVCPTKAIEKLTIEEKKEFKTGTAVVDRNRCYTYADGYNCAVCEEHCPVPDKSIRFREVDVWNFNGELVKVKQIYVVPDKCIGCGHCENVCPRSDAPGILLSSEEEDREFIY